MILKAASMPLPRFPRARWVPRPPGRSKKPVEYLDRLFPSPNSFTRPVKPVISPSRLCRELFSSSRRAVWLPQANLVREQRVTSTVSTTSLIGTDCRPKPKRCHGVVYTLVKSQRQNRTRTRIFVFCRFVKPDDSFFPINFNTVVANTTRPITPSTPVLEGPGTNCRPTVRCRGYWNWRLPQLWLKCRPPPPARAHLSCSGELRLSESAIVELKSTVPMRRYRKQNAAGVIRGADGDHIQLPLTSKGTSTRLFPSGIEFRKLHLTRTCALLAEFAHKPENRLKTKP